MQPIFTHQPVLLGVLVASLLMWRVMETSIDIRSFKRLRAGAQRQDNGSQMVLIVLLTLGVAISWLMAMQVPATAITFSRVFLFWLGILLIYAGMALRFSAITTLGAFFTTTVAIAPEQTVIEAGPYRLIRHPSYTGLLILLLGLGLCLTNWLSLLILMGCAAFRLLVSYPGGRTCPPGAVGPAVSGVYAAHETAHPLCLVTEYTTQRWGQRTRFTALTYLPYNLKRKYIMPSA